MISFKDFLLEASNAIEKQIEEYQKQKAYMQKKGKIPPKVYTKLDRSSYYDFIDDEIIRLQKELESKVDAPILSNTKFKSWFGSSKVVDRFGNPIPVYHGSNADIKEFNHRYNQSSSNASQYGAGFYFTTNQADASRYANSNKDSAVVYKVYLSIKKPLESTATKQLSRIQIKRFIQSAPNWKETLNNFEDISYQGLERSLSNTVNTLHENQSETLLNTLFEINNDWYDSHDEEFVSCVKDILGYDGIHVKLRDTEHWIAFFPNQIKSVFSNKFSKKSGNINESINV